MSPAEALTALDDQDQQSHQQQLSTGGIAATQETVDKAAALYHMRDLCDEGDTMDVIVQPKRVTLAKFSSSNGNPVTGYTGVVSFTTPKPQRKGNESGGIGNGNGVGIGGGGRIPVSVDGAAAGPSLEGPLTSKSTCHYLLVRMEAQETDFVVFFNVPHDEFDVAGDPRGLSREEELGNETIAKFVEELEVRDWGLFV